MHHIRDCRAWNWEKQDWPHFTWEEHFLTGVGKYAGIVKHLEPLDEEHLVIEAIGIESLTTSEIEGDILDRASVQSSIRKQLGLALDKRKLKAIGARDCVHLFRVYSSI